VEIKLKFLDASMTLLTFLAMVNPKAVTFAPKMHIQKLHAFDPVNGY
jgi:hypothetical protein